MTDFANLIGLLACEILVLVEFSEKISGISDFREVFRNVLKIFAGFLSSLTASRFYRHRHAGRHPFLVISETLFCWFIEYSTA